MPSLLLQCVGPMQAWGTRSRFQYRDTEREPTKSGVIGLVCAALGRDRNEPVRELAALRFGVRVDREGVVLTDYHTAQGVAKASGAGTEDQLSYRQYLSDAAFLVGFEGERGLLTCMHRALANPVWPLFLGRRAFPPSQPVHLPDGLREESLEEALRRYQGVAPKAARSPRPERMRLLLECAPGEEGDERRDQPISFAYGARRFANRHVRTVWIGPPPEMEDDRCI